MSAASNAASLECDNIADHVNTSVNVLLHRKDHRHFFLENECQGIYVYDEKLGGLFWLYNRTQCLLKTQDLAKFYLCSIVNVLIRL